MDRTLHFFAPAIEKPVELIVPTIVVFEVYRRIRQQRDRHAALEAVATLHAGRIVEITLALAIAAAAISHSEKLPMADSIILATARAENAVIWTQDANFKRIIGVKFRARR
jgi:toxin FitB